MIDKYYIYAESKLSYSIVFNLSTDLSTVYPGELKSITLNPQEIISGFTNFSRDEIPGNQLNFYIKKSLDGNYLNLSSFNVRMEDPIATPIYTIKFNKNSQFINVYIDNKLSSGGNYCGTLTIEKSSQKILNLDIYCN